jgi:hypothetical protein
MVRLSFVCVALLVTCVAFAGGPQIHCENPIHNFGDRGQNEKFDVPLVLENRGDVDLRITDINLSCGCTKGDIPTKELKPGQKTSLTVAVDTSKKGPGKHDFKVRVHSNDPEHPVYTLSLRGRIVPAFSAPTDLALGDIRRGEAKTATIRVERLKGSKSVITSVNCTAPFISARITASPTGDNDFYGIELGVSSTAPAGPIDHILSMQTDDPKQRTLTVNVGGRVVSEVEVSLERVFFGPVNLKDAPARDILITQAFSRDGKDFKVLEAAAKGTHLDIAVEPVKEGQSYRVRVKVKPDTPAGALTDTLTIKTTNESFRTIEVPVYGLIRK